MKTPRLDDYAQTPTRPLRELHSPLDDMPRIEKPPRHHPNTARQHNDVTPAGHSTTVLPERANARTGERVPTRRIITRNSFEIYEDQMEILRKRAYQERMSGKVGSMSRMVREAIDRYLKDTASNDAD